MLNREVPVVVSLGSNIKPRTAYLEKARSALATMPCTHLVKASSIIETEPVGVPAEFTSMKFLNQVLLMRTSLTPHDFSLRMHAIEDDLGRIRTVRNGPRTIDIDMIDYDGIVCMDPELTLPHPRAKERDFVMRPLAELGVTLK